MNDRVINEEDLDIHKKKVLEVKSWFQQQISVLEKRSLARPEGILVVYGPTGSGKTCCIRALCKTFNISIREWEDVSSGVQHNEPYDEFTSLYSSKIQRIHEFLFQGKRYSSLDISFDDDSPLSSNSSTNSMSRPKHSHKASLTARNDERSMLLIDGLPLFSSLQDQRKFISELEAFSCSYQQSSFIEASPNSTIGLVLILTTTRSTTEDDFLISKLKGQRNFFRLIKFNEVAPTLMKRIVEKANAEHIKANISTKPSSDVVSLIVDAAGGDIRNALNALSVWEAIERSSAERSKQNEGEQEYIKAIKKSLETENSMKEAKKLDEASKKSASSEISLSPPPSPCLISFPAQPSPSARNKSAKSASSSPPSVSFSKSFTSNSQKSNSASSSPSNQKQSKKSVMSLSELMKGGWNVRLMGLYSEGSQTATLSSSSSSSSSSLSSSPSSHSSTKSPTGSVNATHSPLKSTLSHSPVAVSASMLSFSPKTVTLTPPNQKKSPISSSSSFSSSSALANTPPKEDSLTYLPQTQLPSSLTQPSFLHSMSRSAPQQQQISSSFLSSRLKDALFSKSESSTSSISSSLRSIVGKDSSVELFHLVARFLANKTEEDSKTTQSKNKPQDSPSKSSASKENRQTKRTKTAKKPSKQSSDVSFKDSKIASVGMRFSPHQSEKEEFKFEDEFDDLLAAEVEAAFKATQMTGQNSQLNFCSHKNEWKHELLYPFHQLSHEASDRKREFSSKGMKEWYEANFTLDDEDDWKAAQQRVKELESSFHFNESFSNLLSFDSGASEISIPLSDSASQPVQTIDVYQNLLSSSVTFQSFALFIHEHYPLYQPITTSAPATSFNTSHNSTIASYKSTSSYSSSFSCQPFTFNNSTSFLPFHSSFFEEYMSSPSSATTAEFGVFTHLLSDTLLLADSLTVTSYTSSSLSPSNTSVASSLSYSLSHAIAALPLILLGWGCVCGRRKNQKRLLLNTSGDPVHSSNSSFTALQPLNKPQFFHAANELKEYKQEIVALAAANSAPMTRTSVVQRFSPSSKHYEMQSFSFNTLSTDVSVSFGELHPTSSLSKEFMTDILPFLSLFSLIPNVEFTLFVPPQTAQETHPMKYTQIHNTFSQSAFLSSPIRSPPSSPKKSQPIFTQRAMNTNTPSSFSQNLNVSSTQIGSSTAPLPALSQQKNSVISKITRLGQKMREQKLNAKAEAAKLLPKVAPPPVNKIEQLKAPIVSKVAFSSLFSAQSLKFLSTRCMSCSFWNPALPSLPLSSVCRGAATRTYVPLSSILHVVKWATTKRSSFMFDEDEEDEGEDIGLTDIPIERKQTDEDSRSFHQSYVAIPSLIDDDIEPIG
ncbi:putative cell cycle checkpoint protein [Monocercomonoides exilis]|uniref:putative cell cycle checkpoint protein n=1 Tax=Monocercomonoides exilis TaxID=2049356 RepID=UPI00355A2BE0|nr:putative cell cycle checkpoint protein [Monocercomonoides exilis]|eukprot:MONOS_8798.1-p1 / transcript=MONOS_8798.1 / gene=MONOS_8798 / organism=Monocercomonoides_exilis_PA203 / gene_product=unspecified product / transcript_product=unspecified product / location=Mono_scaffold00342:24082-28242(-) / protein_length=1338 / sequence_SO=supercontig / SO=protein_coding / is_pseudo=false